MEEWQEKLIELRELSEKLTQTERKRQQLDIIGKTINLKNRLDKVTKKLKSPNRTAGDVKKHMQLLTELRLLYRTDNLKSPLNILKREKELISRLYNGITQAYQNIIAEINSENN